MTYTIRSNGPFRSSDRGTHACDQLASCGIYV